MKRKGISPLIAAVLLIAFTMAIASIFAQWAPQLIQSAQGDTLNQSEQVRNCVNANLEVKRDISNETTVVVSRSSGDYTGDLEATFFYGQTPVQPDNTPQITEDQTSIAITLTDLSDGIDPEADFTKAEITPECDGAPTAVYEP